MHRLGKLTSDSTERKQYLQLKIGSYSFGKQNFKHLVQQLDFIRSKVYCLSGVKKRKHNWQVTTFPVIPVDGG